MSSQYPSTDTIITGIVSLLAGGGFTKLGEAIFGRKSREVKALGDTIRIMAEQQERFDDRLEKAEAKVDACEAKHEECERGRQEDRSEIEQLRSLVDQIRPADQLPAYHLNAPKGSPGRGRGR